MTETLIVPGLDAATDPMALLVAPAETQGSDRIGPFGPIVERPMGVPAMVVASRNDPWMRFTRARGLALDWEADLIDLGFSGHVNVASGFGPWPEGKALRDRLMGATAARPPRAAVGRKVAL